MASHPEGHTIFKMLVFLQMDRNCISHDDDDEVEIDKDQEEKKKAEQRNSIRDLLASRVDSVQDQVNKSK